MPDIATLKVTLDAQAAKLEADALAAKLTNLGTAGTAANMGLTASQQQLQARLDQTLGAVGALDITNQKAIETIRKQINENIALSKAMIGTRDASAMQAAQMQQAIGIASQLEQRLNNVEGAQGRAAAGAAGHGLQLGRLRMELGTLVGRLTGTNTALDRMGGAIASIGLGDVAVIGALAGIAALSFAYQKLSEHLRGTTKEQEKAIESFKKAQATLAAGGAEQQMADTLQKKITLEQQAIASAGAGPAAAPSTEAGFVAEAGRKAALDQKKKALADNLALERAAQAELADLHRKSNQAYDDALTQNLAALIKSGHATAAEHANALALEQGYAETLRALRATGNADLAAQVAIQNAIKGIRDAIDGGAQSALETAQRKLANEREYGAVLLETGRVHQRIADLQEDMNRKLAIEKKIREDVAYILSGQLPAMDKWAIGQGMTMAEIDAAEARVKSWAQRASTVSEFAAAQGAKPQTIEQQLALDVSYFDKHLRLEAQYNAWEIEQMQKREKAEQEALKASLEEQDHIRRKALTEIQRSVSTLFDDLFTKGTNAFAALWDTVKRGFFKVVSDILAADVMKAVTNRFGETLGGLLPNGTRSVEDMGNASKPLGSASLLGAGVATAFVGEMFAIGSSIMQTTAQNARAAREFADANVKWKASFDSLMSSFTATSADKQRTSLASQFQALMDSAIAAAATAIQNSPAAKFGASGVGLFGKTVGTIPGAGTIDQLDAYIAQLQKAQGTGRNVAQDRDLATLLAQLQKLDAAYKEQAAALEAVIKAQQDAFNADLKVRLLRAQGFTEEADALARQLAEQKELDAAQKAGYDAATIAALKLAQQAEDAATAAAKAKAATDAQAVINKTNQTAMDDARGRMLVATNDPTAAAYLRELQKQREIDALVAAGANAVTIELTKLAQAAEDAAAATAKAVAAQQAIGDLHARLLAATGNQTAADDLRFQLAQQKELADAIAAHAGDDQIALLKQVLAAEAAKRQAAAAAGATSGATSGAAAVNAGVTNVTSAVTATVTNQTALILVDLARAEVQILERIANNTADGGKGAVHINVTVNAGDSSTDAGRQDIVTRLLRELDKQFGATIVRQQIASGSVAR